MHFLKWLVVYLFNIWLSDDFLFFLASFVHQTITYNKSYIDEFIFWFFFFFGNFCFLVEMITWCNYWCGLDGAKKKVKNIFTCDNLAMIDELCRCKNIFRVFFSRQIRMKTA